MVKSWQVITIVDSNDSKNRGQVEEEDLGDEPPQAQGFRRSAKHGAVVPTVPPSDGGHHG